MLGKVETYDQKTHDEFPVAEETTCNRRDVRPMTLEALPTFVMIKIDKNWSFVFASVDVRPANRAWINYSLALSPNATNIIVHYCVTVVAWCAEVDLGEEQRLWNSHVTRLGTSPASASPSLINSRHITRMEKQRNLREKTLQRGAVPRSAPWWWRV